MEAALEKQLIEIIEAEWVRLPESHRPFGVWIRRYAPLSMNTTDLDDLPDNTMPEAVWFLDETGLRRENVWKWMRYLAVQQFVRDSSMTDNPNPHLGLAALAYYINETNCYLEMQWGTRFGSGYRWTLHEGRLKGRDRIWVS